MPFQVWQELCCVIHPPLYATTSRPSKDKGPKSSPLQAWYPPLIYHHHPTTRQWMTRLWLCLICFGGLCFRCFSCVLGSFASCCVQWEFITSLPLKNQPCSLWCMAMTAAKYIGLWGQISVFFVFFFVCFFGWSRCLGLVFRVRRDTNWRYALMYLR